MARTVGVIQARMGSTRLPGKVMKPFCGMPMLAFQLHRLRACAALDAVVVATSDLARDGAIAELAEREGAGAFRGSEDDVLGRFAAAAAAYDADRIVRITGDNPLIDPALLDRTVARLAEGEVDYVSSFAGTAFPFGVGCCAFTRACLDKAAHEARAAYDREHVEPFMLSCPDIRRAVIAPDPRHHRPDIRVTVDTAEDFARAELLAWCLAKFCGSAFDLDDVVFVHDQLVDESKRSLAQDGRNLHDAIMLFRSLNHRKFHRMLPVGDYVTDRWERARFYGFGEGTSVYDNVLVVGDVRVGRNVWIGPNVHLDGSGSLVIGDGCDISSGAQIYSHVRDLRDHRKSISGIKAALVRRKTTIGSGVYIGPNAVIEAGATIGDGCVIGALTLVRGDVPSGTKCYGQPGRIVGPVD